MAESSLRSPLRQLSSLACEPFDLHQGARRDRTIRDSCGTDRWVNVRGLILLAKHMRTLIVVCAVFIGVYGADQIFYSGTYTNAAVHMVSRIGHSFR